MCLWDIIHDFRVRTTSGLREGALALLDGDVSPGGDGCPFPCSPSLSSALAVEASASPSLAAEADPNPGAGRLRPFFRFRFRFPFLHRVLHVFEGEGKDLVEATVTTSVATVVVSVVSSVGADSTDAASIGPADGEADEGFAPALNNDVR